MPAVVEVTVEDPDLLDEVVSRRDDPDPEAPELLGRAPAIERVQAALAAGLSQGLGMSFTPGAATAREEALDPREEGGVHD